jgi:hypothetical protein
MEITGQFHGPPLYPGYKVSVPTEKEAFFTLLENREPLPCAGNRKKIPESSIM